MNLPLFKNIENKHLLVIGDVMLDVYVEGSVYRNSPEAPVPVLSHEQSYKRLGGAANVALNIKSLGCKVSLISVVGDDAAGSNIKNLLADNTIECKLIVDNQRQTTVKKRFIADSKHLLRVDTEDDFDINEAVENKVWEEFQKKCKEGITGVVISDYNKGILTTDLIRNIIKECKLRNIATYVDPKHRNFWEYRNCTIFKPNLNEITTALSQSSDNIKELAQKAYEKLSCEILVCTMAQDGMVYQKKEEYQWLKQDATAVVDVSGAGDTVMAAMAVAHQCDIEISRICRLCNEAGGWVCTQKGVVSISLDKLTNTI